MLLYPVSLWELLLVLSAPCFRAELPIYCWLVHLIMCANSLLRSSCLVYLNTSKQNKKPSLMGYVHAQIQMSVTTWRFLVMKWSLIVHNHSNQLGNISKIVFLWPSCGLMRRNIHMQICKHVHFAFSRPILIKKCQYIMGWDLDCW